jgi:hypothetical protein
MLLESSRPGGSFSLAAKGEKFNENKLKYLRFAPQLRQTFKKIATAWP